MLMGSKPDLDAISFEKNIERKRDQRQRNGKAEAHINQFNQI